MPHPLLGANPYPKQFFSFVTELRFIRVEGAPTRFNPPAIVTLLPCREINPTSFFLLHLEKVAQPDEAEGSMD